jgi:hypothetical protein
VFGCLLTQMVITGSEYRLSPTTRAGYFHDCSWGSRPRLYADACFRRLIVTLSFAPNFRDRTLAVGHIFNLISKGTPIMAEKKELTAGQKAARTKKRRAAAKKAVLTKKHKAAGVKAAQTKANNAARARWQAQVASDATDLGFEEWRDSR